MLPEDLHKDWKPGDPIGYIQPDIPEVNLPPCNGERYEALVPDTLDLAERASLAIHGMTEPTDPQADYEVYWHVLFRCHPPMMRHEWPGMSMRPKFEETVSLMRIMCGSDQNSHVEQRWGGRVADAEPRRAALYAGTRPSVGLPRFASPGRPELHAGG
jgi:hypothetical protein